MTKCRMQMSVVVTCKGRLRFLQQTAPRLMGEPDLEYVLVDWDCPEGSGEWLKRNYPQAKVVSVAPREWFHASAARNLGALASSGELLVFSDVDMLYEPGFADDIRDAWSPGKILLFGDREGDSGFVVMSREDFFRSGGYDERYTGYGYEDHEMRKSLEILGLTTERLLPFKRYHIHHSNEDRTRYYQEKDKRISQRVNAKRLAEEPIRMFHGCVLNAASGPIPEAPLPSGASTGNASELTALLRIVRWKKPRRVLDLYPFAKEEARGIAMASPLAHIYAYDRSGGSLPYSFTAAVHKTPILPQDREKIGTVEYTILSEDKLFDTVEQAVERNGPFDLVCVHSEHAPGHVAIDTHLALRLTADEGTFIWFDYGSRCPEVRGFVDAISEKAIAVVENTEIAFIQLTPAIRQRLTQSVMKEVSRCSYSIY